jgi:hypothetical protein
MTEQTKRYVELSDLVNVHLTCKHCGASITLRLRSLSDSPVPLPATCVGCTTPWTSVEGVPTHKALKEFAAALEILERVIAKRQVSLRIELSPQPDAK